MREKSLLLGGSLFFIAIFFLHSVGILFHFYWTLPWFDVLMHLLGGIMVAFMSVFLASNLAPSYLAGNDIRRTLFIAVASALFIGILWEIFEFSAGLTFVTKPNYLTDTMKDLGMDIVGGIVATWFLKKRHDGTFKNV